MRGGPGHQRGVHPAQAVLMEQRQRVHQHIPGGPPPSRQRGPDGHRQLPVGERNAFGPSGGTGRVREQRRVPRPHHPLLPNASARPATVRRYPGHRGDRQRRRTATGQAGQPGRRARVGQREHRTGVGHQVTEFGGGVPRVGQHDDRARLQRAQVAAQEAQAGPGRQQDPVARLGAGGQPVRDLTGPGRQPGVGDRLAVHGDRHPVREPARRLGRQVRDGRRAKLLDECIQPASLRRSHAEMRPPAAPAPRCR